MSEQINTTTITLLDKAYKIKCPPEKVAELRESMKYLDGKLREVAQPGKPNQIDRVVVVAALNIAHELLSHKRQTNAYVDVMGKRIQDLQNKIDAALEETS